MADFPRVRVFIDSEEAMLDEALVSRSRAGRVRIRRLYDAPQREFKVLLRGLTDAERDDVQNFLTVNKKLAFGFRWPRGGMVYQVVWLDSAIRWKDQGARLSATDLTFAVVT